MYLSKININATLVINMGGNKITLTIVAVFFALAINSQSNKPDSLLQCIKTAINDTSRFNACLALGNYFQNSNPDTALHFHQKAIRIAEKIPGAEGELRKGEATRMISRDIFVKGSFEEAYKVLQEVLVVSEKYHNSTDNNILKKAKILWASALSNLGSIYSEKSEYNNALVCYFKALKTISYYKNKKGQATILGNIGIVYYRLSDYNRALDYYFRALKLNEEIGYRPSQPNNLNGIGLIYSELSDFKKANYYYNKAIKIYDEVRDNYGKATVLNNIGINCMESADYTNALKYYQEALKLDVVTGNLMGQARHLGNIGNVFAKIGENDKAIDCYNQAMKLNDEIGAKQNTILGNIATVYIKQKKIGLAEKCLKQAEKINLELGSVYYLDGDCKNLSELYEQTNRYKEALHYYKEHIKYRDSVQREENQNAMIAKEMQYQFEKREGAVKEEQKKKDILVKEEKRRQQLITYVISGFALLILLLAAVILRSLKNSKQKNRIITEQKKLVDAQNKLVEEKNKDIIDSITYAKRIQQAILPSEKVWRKNLPDSFVFYQPKDIVAGDFYWMEETENYVFAAAADCTGHGVPGAMISVVCSNALTKAVLEEKVTETNILLDKTRDIVLEKLSNSEENIRDGMDICLLRFNKRNKKEVQYSGANRSLLRISKGKFIEYPANKQPIGDYEKPQPFTPVELLLEQNDMLYLVTDGFADQFGGHAGKKFKTKQLYSLLLEQASRPLEQQCTTLKEVFVSWKSNNEQTDDVTVIGVRL